MYLKSLLIHLHMKKYSKNFNEAIKFNFFYLNKTKRLFYFFWLFIFSDFFKLCLFLFLILFNLFIIRSIQYL